MQAALAAKAAEEKKKQKDIEMKEERLCKENYRRCKDNEALFEVYRFVASAACVSATEKATRFGEPKWKNWFKFSTYLKGRSYIDSGVLKLFDEDVQIQNGFGAWKNTEIECQYNLDSKEVIGVIERR